MLVLAVARRGGGRFHLVQIPVVAAACTKIGSVLQLLAVAAVQEHVLAKAVFSEP